MVMDSEHIEQLLERYWLKESLEEEKAALKDRYDAEKDAAKDAYEARKDQIDAELKAEKERLNAIIDGINEEIQARRELREDEEQDDAIAEARKRLEAAEAQRVCPDGRKHPGLWAALALLLAGLYMLLTFTPPGWGPFVNPLG